MSSDEHHSWPQLVGKDGDEAVEIIKRESGRRFEHFVER